MQGQSDDALLPFFFLNYPDLEVCIKSNHVSLWLRKQEPHNNHNNNSTGRSPRSRSTLLGSQPICPPEIRQDECGMRFAANRYTNKTHSVKTLPVCNRTEVAFAIWFVSLHTHKHFKTDSAWSHTGSCGGRLYCKQVNTLTALHHLLSAAVHRLHLCLFEWRIVTQKIQTFSNVQIWIVRLKLKISQQTSNWNILMYCFSFSSLFFYFILTSHGSVVSCQRFHRVCVCVLETPIVTWKQCWLLCQVFYVRWSVHRQTLSTCYHHSRAVVLAGGWYSHETSQVCTPDQNEGRVQEWTWTHPWILSAYTCPVLYNGLSSVNIFELH